MTRVGSIFTPGAHRARERDRAQVGTLRGRRLGANDRVDQRVDVFEQRLLFEVRLADQRVHDRGLVETILDLTGLDVADRVADVRRDRAGLRIGHLLREDAAEFLTDRRHHVRRSDRNVEVGEPGFDLFDQIVFADHVRTGGFGLFEFVAARERDDAHRTAGAVRQADRTAHVLIGLLRIDAQADVDLDRLVELRVGVLLHQRNGFVGREQRFRIESGDEVPEPLAVLAS